eukprot:1992657-Amphidinium_carterae.1
MEQSGPQLVLRSFLHGCWEAQIGACAQCSPKEEMFKFLTSVFNVVLTPQVLGVTIAGQDMHDSNTSSSIQ